MNFIDNKGQSLKKNLKNKIEAFQTLKRCDVKINDFNDNGYWKNSSVDVIEELKWLLCLVENFSSNEYYSNLRIEDTSISKSNRLITGYYDENSSDKEKKEIENYGELNIAIIKRTEWIINKAMSKEIVVTKEVEKKVNKSIDMNTRATVILGVFGLSTAFFVGCGDKRLCEILGIVTFVLGIVTFVIGLIIWNYKQKFFKETE